MARGMLALTELVPVEISGITRYHVASVGVNGPASRFSELKVNSSHRTLLLYQLREHLWRELGFRAVRSGLLDGDGGSTGGERSEERRVGKECRSRWWAGD